jgi:hypothetical protein
MCTGRPAPAAGGDRRCRPRMGRQLRGAAVRPADTCCLFSEPTARHAMGRSQGVGADGPSRDARGGEGGRLAGRPGSYCHRRRFEQARLWGPAGEG